MTVLEPTGLDHRARAADLGADSRCELAHELEVLLAADAAAHDDQALGVGDRALVGRRGTLEYLDAGARVGRERDLLNRARAAGIGLRRLEDARTHRRHLRTERRAHDGGHQVAAERGARLVKKPALLVHLEHGAVRGEARLQAHGDAGGELAAEVRRAVENDLGLSLSREVAEQPRVALGVVLGQALVAAGEHMVGARRDELRGIALGGVRALAQHGAHVAAAARGELAGAAEQLEGHRHHGARRVGLAEDPDARVGREVGRPGGLAALDSDRAHGARVDAGPAVHAVAGGHGAAGALLALDADSVIGTSLDTTSAAHALLGVDEKTSHYSIPSRSSANAAA